MLKSALGTALLLVVGVLAALPAAADTIEGTISTTSEVDYYHFSSAGGTASFNIWGTNYPGGLTGSGLQDSYVYLYRDDGSPEGALTGGFVISNDDSFDSGWDSDGSTSILDSFISGVSLSAGNYILAVGSFFLSDEDARDGTNENSFNTGDYRLTFSGVSAVSSVPEPTTFALIGLGAAGLAWNRRRAQKRAA